MSERFKSWRKTLSWRANENRRGRAVRRMTSAPNERPSPRITSAIRARSVSITVPLATAPLRQSNTSACSTTTQASPPDSAQRPPAGEYGSPTRTWSTRNGAPVVSLMRAPNRMAFLAEAIESIGMSTLRKIPPSSACDASGGSTASDLVNSAPTLTGAVITTEEPLAD